MKSVFIIYNQALGEIVMKMLDYLDIKGFTMWEDVKGRGTHTGEPHLGTHTWPAMNSAVLAVVENEQVPPLTNAVEKLNEKAEQQGIRAFVWAVEQTV
jgi:nitrogen regulatory protein PII